MIGQRSMLIRIVLLVLAQGLAGCGGSGSSSAPSAPSPVPQPVPQPAPITCSMVESAAPPSEGWTHVPEGTPITFRHNPPTSGPHYPVWARYDEYVTLIARGYWVHNVERGATVLLYRPGAAAELITELVDAYRSIPDDPVCRHRWALITPDPELPGPVAVVNAEGILQGACVNAQQIRNFAVGIRHHYSNVEGICAQGTRP
jgi:uncharacterized protein DUF3105